MYTLNPFDMPWRFIEHNVLYKGKSYGEWVCDWFNWFLSADADNRNSGPVVFLRSRGLPNRLTGANTSDVPGTMGTPKDMLDSSTDDQSYSPSFSGTYVNDPNVRIGGDRLRIFDDQAVLVPIIIAYWLRYETNTDWGSMQEFTGLTIDYGDDPPDPRQLTVMTQNDEDEIPIVKDGLAPFRFVTPIFTAVVPDVQYGRSVKDFLESPVAPGSYPALVEGYFVMIQFYGKHPEEGGYWIHSWASAPREVRGPYFSELLYQIEVAPRKPQESRGMKQVPPGRVTRWRPPRNERILSKILEQKEQSGDLTALESKQFKKYFTVDSYDRVLRRMSRRMRKPLV
jgi:hypothetical protein